MLLCPKTVLFRNFVSFVLILLSSVLHSRKKGLCDPIFPFVKTIGPGVYEGNFLIMLVSKETIAVGA